MGYTPLSCYALQTASTSSTPLANQTYYIGCIIRSVQAGTSANLSGKIFVPYTGMVTKVVITVSGTVGSNEATSLYLRKNDTTDTTLSTTLDFSAATINQTFTLNTPVSAGDYLNLKLVCPGWVTAPSAMFFSSTIFITTA